MKEYRQGGLGAMMDEYDRAAADLIKLLTTIDSARFEQVTDPSAPEHTRSIQSIMRHVVNSGYGYANYLRKIWEIPVASPQVTEEPRDGAIAALYKVLA